MSLRGLAIGALAVGLASAFPTLGAAPPGWIIAGSAPADYEFAVDSTTAASGKRSASITAKRGAKSDGFGTLMQTIAADNYRGARTRLSGYLRTDAANRAQMWMRVDGSGGKVLSFDNMDSRPATGTTGWTRYDIVLDVPPDSVDIAFGFFLISSGKVWGDDFKLEKVNAAVPVTSAGPTLPRAPINPDFEDADSSQPTSSKTIAVWTPRKLVQLSPPGFISCNQLIDRVKFVLLQLGAHAGDMYVDRHDCSGELGTARSIDVTFSVLAPTDTTGKNVAGSPVEAHWQIVELKGDCQFLEYVTQKVLPLFSTRNVKLIPWAFCEKYNVGLRAEVLKSHQE